MRGSEHTSALAERGRLTGRCACACLGCVKLSPSTSPPLAIAGTALFEKYHPWVNTAGILWRPVAWEGSPNQRTPTLLSTRHCRWSSASTAATGVGAPADVAAAPDRMGVERPRARVTWDEAGIQAHDAERGVRFGTMTISRTRPSSSWTPTTPAARSRPFTPSTSRHTCRRQSGRVPALIGCMSRSCRTPWAWSRRTRRGWRASAARSGRIQKGLKRSGRRCTGTKHVWLLSPLDCPTDGPFSYPLLSRASRFTTTKSQT